MAQLSPRAEPGVYDDLVDQAEGDPAGVAARCRLLLDDRRIVAIPHDHATVLRAAAIAARVVGDVAAALGLFDRALPVAELSGNDELVREVRTSRAAALFQSGNPGDALGELAEVLQTATSRRSAGFARLQRGTIFGYLGRFSEAESDLSIALADLDAVGAGRYGAHAVGNRGLVRALVGQFAPAERDLREALGRYEALGLGSAAAETLHNLGFVAQQRGRLLEAIRLYERAEEQNRRLGVPAVALELAHSKLLVVVGLAAEGYDRALALTQRLVAAGAPVDAGDAALVAAIAATHVGRFEDAARVGAMAAELFARHGREGHAALAELTMVRGRLLAARGADRVGSAFFAQAADVCGRLRSSADPAIRAEATVLAAELALAAGEPIRSIDTLRAGQLRNCAADLRSRADACRAEAELRCGSTGAARRAVREGLRRVEAVRASFGAIELRAAIGTHADSLVRTSIALAARSRRPWQLVVCTEAQRAASLQFPTSGPVRDDETSAVLQQLHQLDQKDEGPTTPARRTELQNRLRDAGRTTGASGSRLRCPQLASLREHLAGRRLVSLVEDGEDLLAVVVDFSASARASTYRVGSALDVSEGLASACMALGRAARTDTTERSRTLALDHAVAVALRADRQLAPALGDGSRPLLLIPPTALLAAPWALLGALRNRAFSVSPSLTVWCAGRSTRVSPLRRVVVIGGPAVGSGSAELEEVAAQWPEATVLDPSSGFDRALQMIDGADVAHLMAHHQHRTGNPLFSSILLGGGSIYGHDLLGLSSAPRVVVLSACEAATSDVVGTHESFGTTLAFLAAGSCAVIASASLVPDDDRVSALMVGLHRGLAAGLGPAAALAVARRRAFEAGVSAATWAPFSVFER